jgi:PAS domain S-box-containing protein
LEVLEEIRRGEAPPPVVVVTGRGDEQVAVEAMKGGAYDYVVKSDGYLQRLPIAALLAVESRQLAVERKRAEEARRESEEKYRLLFENAVEGIFQTTPDGCFLSANPAMSSILGYASPEELITSCMDIGRQSYVFPKKREELKRLIEERGQIRNFENQVYRKDGSKVWISEDVRVVKGRDGEILYYEGMVQDITERKHAEDALKNFSRRLLLVREEEKKRISENIHREVGHITGTLDLITDSVKKKITSGDLTAALESCRKFKPIFHDFISNLRTLIHVLRPPELDIIGLTGTLSHYFADIEKETGLKIIFQSTVNEKKIRDNTPIILFRVVQEAVNNILKHSEANRVRVGLKCARGMIILTIKDNGRGFVPLKDKKKGESGIGLRLIGEMVESMNGTFEIHSSPGKGTELFVSLPPAKLPNPKPPSRKRKR